MFRNMVTSLFKYDRIRTTDAKAKELRIWSDRLITLAKRGDLHARRQALSVIREKEVVYKIFNEAPERFGKISGGYTRVVKLKNRRGDGAPMSVVELVFSRSDKKKQPKKKIEDQEKKTDSNEVKIETKEEQETKASNSTQEVEEKSSEEQNNLDTKEDSSQQPVSETETK